MTTDALTTIAARPASAAVYAELVDGLRTIGEHDIEPKRGSVHVTRGSAFLGVHPRSTGVVLNIVTDTPILSTRIRRSETLSPRRSHNEVLVTDPSQLDEELWGWIRDAYRRASR